MVFEILTLLVTFFGGLIGGYLSFLGAVRAIKKQIDYQEEQNKESALQSLLQELKENEVLANTWTNDFNAPLIYEAWSVYKGSLYSLPLSVQAKIQQAYIEIKQHNAIVEHNRIIGKEAPNRGDPILVQAEKARKACTDAISTTTEYVEEIRLRKRK